MKTTRFRWWRFIDTRMRGRYAWAMRLWSALAILALLATIAWGVAHPAKVAHEFAQITHLFVAHARSATVARLPSPAAGSLTLAQIEQPATGHGIQAAPQTIRLAERDARANFRKMQFAFAPQRPFGECVQLLL